MRDKGRTTSWNVNQNGSNIMLSIYLIFRACFGSTYIKIGTIQRRLAWPLRKDDTQIREAFQIFFFSDDPGTDARQKPGAKVESN